MMLLDEIAHLSKLSILLGFLVEACELACSIITALCTKDPSTTVWAKPILRVMQYVGSHVGLV